MKVKELIELLSDKNPDAELVLGDVDEDNVYTLETIDYGVYIRSKRKVFMKELTVWDQMNGFTEKLLYTAEKDEHGEGVDAIILLP